MGLLDLIRPTRRGAVAPDAPPGQRYVPNQKRQFDPRQERARLQAQSIGLVRNSYRFLAHQAARCPVHAEFTADNGLTWERPVDSAMVDMIPQVVATLVKPPGRPQADLIRAAVFLDETVGEYRIVQETDPVTQMPAWTARDFPALKRTGEQYLVMDVPGGTPEKNTGQYVPLTSVFRHWQPSEEWQGFATSSLIGIVDDVDTYWNLIRNLNRRAHSRLAMDKIVATPSSAFSETVMADDGQPISLLEQDWADVAKMAIDDLDDRNVEVMLPFLMKVPDPGGVMAMPQVLDLGAIDPELLPYIKDAREVVAAGMPLTTQQILDGQADPNHWNKWAADDDDIEAVESSARRTLDSFTLAAFRPTLLALISSGRWSGNPEQWRLAIDTDAIRARVDNSENARFALTQRIIKPKIGLEALHFTGDDIADPEAFAFYAQVAAVTPKTGNALFDAEVAAGVPPAEAAGAVGKTSPGQAPNGGVAPTKELTTGGRSASMVTLVNDDWLLGDDE